MRWKRFRKKILTAIDLAVFLVKLAHPAINGLCYQTKYTTTGYLSINLHVHLYIAMLLNNL